MTRVVVLQASPSSIPDGYTVRLGPLAFVTPADTVSETIGDGLEAVGGALVAAQRRPRPLKLKLPVRGDRRQLNWDDAGRVLRRQVRALIDNAPWRLQAFYFVWDADPDLDGWLLLGGAEMSEADPGVSFGEFDLDLSDVYIVGRPGTHRPGRRASIADRRGGLVPRDSRRLLYSTDFATQALPTEPLVVPGDVVALVASGNRPVASTTAGPLRGVRRLWRSCAASDGEIVSYLPDEVILPDRTAYLDLDDLGAVRAWDLSAADPYPPAPGDYSGDRDTRPDAYWGWQRVVGDVLTANAPLAVDNGACRLIWLGSGPTQGLAVEWWDDTLGHYRREGRLLHAAGVREQRIVELTPERAVVEWRAGQYAMRAILQRGWWGPRIESYDDGGGTARLEWAPDDGAPTVTPQSPTWVRSVTPAGVVTATNAVPSPSLEQAGIGLWENSGTFLAAGATVSRVADAAAAPAGGFVLAVATTAAGASQGARIPLGVLTAGKTYRARISVQRLNGGPALTMRVGRSDGSLDHVIVNSANPPQGSYQEYTALVTPTQTMAHYLYIRTDTAVATTFWLDRVYVGEDVPYFDGDTAGARWTGAAGASASQLLSRPVVATLVASGMNDEVVDTAPTVIAGAAATWRRTRVLAVQMGFPPGPTASGLASLSLVDARPVPVLVGRR
jgi:hypothetical protein